MESDDQFLELLFDDREDLQDIHDAFLGAQVDHDEDGTPVVERRYAFKAELGEDECDYIVDWLERKMMERDDEAV